MVGLDTNVLVRALVDADDPEQSHRARSYIAANCSPDVPGYVDAVVLCETVWVLSGPMKYQRELVLDVLDRLLNQRSMSVESRDLALQAVALCRSSKLDFADMFIALRNEKQGARPTVTFDRRAAGHPLFKEI